ncbi:MAG: hypothetical protein LPK03_12160, partial [Pontibacter sp.]|nr:hypothetical protein [Pontibacter sp.]
MQKLYLAYLLLTSLFIVIAYKVKDDYFYLPYPNAIEYILAFTLFCITLILLIKRKHRSQKIILGLASMATLLVLTNSMTYFFEWHPLNLSPPFSSSQSVEVNYEPYNWQTTTPASVGYSDAAV